MKLIDLLLRLYPEEFRARFGHDMHQFHSDRIREPGTSWRRIVTDHLVSASAEQLRSTKPDVKYALRGMAKRPAFAAVIILTIALGVGANTAIFGVLNAILFRPLPYREADRLVTFSHDPPHWLVSEPEYATYRDRVRSLESVAVFTLSQDNVLAGSEPERVATASVSPNFFTTLGVQPELGRTFAAGEDRQRPAHVVIISHELWRSLFNGDPKVIGKPMSLGGVPRSVIGVMPEHLNYPSPATALWLPLCSARTCASLGTLAPDEQDGWARHFLFMVARMRRGATVEQVSSEGTAVARSIVKEHPNDFDPAHPLVPSIRSVRDSIVGPTRPYLYSLFAAVSVVLLIVCANVANLLLARGQSRRREMAVRIALGASGRRLITQLLTEALVLALGGGILGALVGIGATQALVAASPSSLPRLDQIHVSWEMMTFCFVVALLAGLIFGVFPAIRAVRVAPAESLHSGGKGAPYQASRGPRQALVVAELALAMVLLTGAGMLTRSLVQMERMDIGFRPEDVLVATVTPNVAAYDSVRSVELYRSLRERVLALPGVQAAGAARWLPVVEAGGMSAVWMEGQTYPPGQLPQAVPQEVTPGYFSAMGMRIVAGRDIDDNDQEKALRVAVVTQSFANAYWPNQVAVGRRFRLVGRDSAWMTVVGVVNDVLAHGYVDKPEPTMYIPHAQTISSDYYTPRAMSMIIRTSTDPMRLAHSVRDVVRSVDPGLPVSNVRTLDAVVGTSVANRRFTTALMVAFAAFALLLAGLGIYGVVSYTASQRAVEIAVRMALGADRRRIVLMVLSDGARLVFVGLAMGLAASVMFARAIRSLLFGVGVVDPPTLLGVAVLLALVAVLASLLPARRASGVSVMVALGEGD
jgi:putative ABC transport system permease protein